MFNSSGAVEQFEVQKTNGFFDGSIESEALSDNRLPAATITLKVRGCGRFGVYSSQRPLKCIVGNTETEFDYEPATRLVTLSIPVPEEEMYRWPIEIQV